MTESPLPPATPSETSAPAQAPPDDAVPQRHGDTRAGRFWSVRRIPAALLAAVVLGGAGLLLYDVVAVRADRPAMHWRRAAADQLARWRPDDPWVLAAAALLALLGLCLLVLALTPGLRRLLPMRRDDPSVRAALERDAAALVLRDRAIQVPGVQSVRVRTRRKKVSVRARSHFRDLDEVRADLDGALGAAIAELGLAKPPAPAVRVVRPPAKKG